MTDVEHQPILGGTAPCTAIRTAGKLATFANKHIVSIQGKLTPLRYLDIGCGNGFITEHVAIHFDDVTGIDVETRRLAEFRSRVAGDARYEICQKSAEATEFPDDTFSFITCFEVLEHVPNLTATVQEIVRICKPGGVVVISAPQRWFPFENHGMQVGRYTFARKIPLLPYVPPLHRRFALARVFSSKGMDRLFLHRGLQLLGTAYTAPQFERAAARAGTWESYIQFLRPALDWCETIPGLQHLFGVSLLKAYQKPLL